MKRFLIYLGIVLSILSASGLGTARARKGSLSGTWECQSHGGPQGDMAFTLYLQQSGETVDGNLKSPLGQTEITSGTFRKNQLELHFDMPQGTYVLMGKLEKGKVDKGKLTGAWSLDTDKGVWEGARHEKPEK